MRQLAIDNFIDNIAALAVERCLLYDLPDIMDPEKAWTMSDEEVAAVAAEDEEARVSRHRLYSQKVALEDTIRICKRQARDRPVDGQYI